MNSFESGIGIIILMVLFEITLVTSIVFFSKYKRAIKLLGERK